MTIDIPARRLDPSAPTASAPAPLVVTPTKSVGIALLLTLLFGPLGLFYASVTGGLVVLLGIPIAGAVALSTLWTHAGRGFFVLLVSLVPLMWIVALVWSAVAVNAYNSRLLRSPR